MLRLGPFELVEPIAHGGMGEVWLGQHVDSGVPVALKILLSTRERLLEGLRNELRAVAAMDHPHIIWLYDQGEVDEQAAFHSEGRFTVGTPWLAMEYAAGGTLARHPARLSWEGLQRVLLELLDALAHAHARGVIHRDIKPANVLFGGERPGIKLTDFGMAYLLERHLSGEGREPSNGGTLSYMSPEQYRRRPVEQGPWTDLYSVGVMTWTLVAGRRPFTGEREALREGHLHQRPPPLEPIMELPPGVEEWLLTLMHKRPSRRFRCAADAARVLLSLRAHKGRGRGRPAPTEEASSTLTLAPFHLDLEVDPDEEQSLMRLTPEVEPSLPEDWREGERPHADMDFIGAGLGLFGLRETPLIGREAERSALWRALLEVRASGRPRVLVLEGETGCGKGRLARWILRRAEELGAAEGLRAHHNPVTSRREGLAELVARHARCTDERREAVLARITRVLGRYEVDDARDILALTELVQPASPEERRSGAVLRLDSAEGRHAVVRRYLALVSRQRPVVLFFDDVQWGLDTLAFVRRLLQSPPVVPALVVLTLSSDQAEEREEELQALDELLALPEVSRARLGPLSEAEQLILVKRLGLGPGLARELSERTRGNPLFAVQLMADWVDRGLLVPDRSGFVLREAVELPASLGALWAERVQRLLAEHPDWRLPVELAALLGLEVHRLEWEQACAEAGVPCPPELLQTLLRHGLARGAPERWSFAHAMFREALLRSSTEGGRAAELHRACARMLQGRQPGRRGRHLLLAGELDRAAEQLLEGARCHLRAGEYAAASRMLRLRAQALPHGDPRHGESHVEQARLCLVRGDLEGMAAWNRRCLEADGELRLMGMLNEAARLRSLGELVAASQQVHGALVLARRRHPERVALCLYEAGVTARRSGELERAAELLSSALATGAGERWESRAWLNLTMVHLQLDRHEAARLCLERAAEDQEPFLLGSCAIVEGDLLRHQGRIDLAEARYHEAWRSLETIGHHSALLARVNVGLAAVAQGELERAEPHLRAGLDHARARVEALGGHLGLLVCTVGRPEWPEHMRALEQSSLVELDHAAFCEQAARRARERGLASEAERAHGHAKRVLERLGRPG